MTTMNVCVSCAMRVVAICPGSATANALTSYTVPYVTVKRQCSGKVTAKKKAKLETMKATMVVTANLVVVVAAATAALHQSTKTL